MSRLRTALLLTLAATALVPAAADASSRQLTVMQDDARILHSTPAVRRAILDEFRGLGTDVVKVQVTWRDIAPTSRPANPANPSAYAWAAVDDAVANIRSRGMRPFLTLGGRAPDYATARRTSRHNGTFRPSPSEFELFTRAAGRRYAGLVDLFSLWNEPGLSSWIQPQRDSRRRPLSPGIYRNLYLAGHRGLVSSGHGGDTILIGELAPLGARSTNKVGPVEFIREMACLDKKYRPFRGRARTARRCPSRLPRIPTSGLAYHPYTSRQGPRSIPRNRDDAPIGALSRVTRALDRVARRGRLARRRPVWITEFGFQTNPPDRFQIPIRRVPGYMDYSEYLAFRNRRVASHAQYTLVDDALRPPGPDRFSNFQQGLRFNNFNKKPGVYRAWEMPLHVKAGRGNRLGVFGGLRAAPGTRVSLKVKTGGSYRNLAIATTNFRGYFSITRRVRRASRATVKVTIGSFTRAKRASR
ncbi:MAG: hypothetical protein M3350_02390 [Actinomycetota bacterium]|nr:hypothetical protein [Actinomycetota bacterium]